MVDIVPNSQEIIGHGSFSIVYRARLKAVRIISDDFTIYFITFLPWITKKFQHNCSTIPLPPLFQMIEFCAELYVRQVMQVLQCISEFLRNKKRTMISNCQHSHNIKMLSVNPKKLFLILMQCFMTWWRKPTCQHGRKSWVLLMSKQAEMINGFLIVFTWLRSCT